MSLLQSIVFGLAVGVRGPQGILTALRRACTALFSWRFFNLKRLWVPVFCEQHLGLQVEGGMGVMTVTLLISSHMAKEEGEGLEGILNI